ncbi:piercer of microtubule wall 1 protein-like isoform X2 [Watersipora subatra]|uniref:piercer of microtubule wall 1 protein-like isoform X2 n=1 Tax=Watersipora subatra TaxID=2589382 RepID=UPI00355C6D25
METTTQPVGGCYIPGNVVFSCQKDVLITPATQQDPSDYLQGYARKPVNPMYKTSAQDYGSKVPTYHSMPIDFFGKSQKFSNHLGVCGMPRNHSLNTAVTPSKV